MADEGKDAGRADEGKDAGRADEGKDAGRGGSDGSFGSCGGGWVVVSFISPVSVDVADLAARILRGRPPQRAGGGNRLQRLRIAGAVAKAQVRRADIHRAKYSAAIPGRNPRQKP
jgi:hypothetical protein